MATDASPRMPDQDLRGLAAEVRSLRAEMEGIAAVMDERDRRYEQRFIAQELAVAQALSAQEKQTNASFVASEKAIVKAEDAQRAYNSSHNDLIRKQDLLVPRLEWMGRNKAVDEKFTDLRMAADTQIRVLDVQVAAIVKNLALIEGRSGGVASLGSIAFSVVMATIAIASVLVAVFK